MVEPHSSNFRVITTNILGVRIFRKFTVYIIRSMVTTVYVTVSKHNKPIAQSHQHKNRRTDIKGVSDDNSKRF